MRRKSEAVVFHGLAGASTIKSCMDTSSRRRGPDIGSRLGSCFAVLFERSLLFLPANQNLTVRYPPHKRQNPPLAGFAVRCDWRQALSPGGP